MFVDSVRISELLVDLIFFWREQRFGDHLLSPFKGVGSDVLFGVEKGQMLVFHLRLHEVQLFFGLVDSVLLLAAVNCENHDFGLIGREIYTQIRDG